MKNAKKIKKMWLAKDRTFRIISAIAFLSLLYFGIKCFVYAEETAVPEQTQETAAPKGFADLIPDGVVYDPQGESFVTIKGEVVKQGEYYYEFLLESITADTVLFSSEDEEYEIPIRSIDRLDSIIESFEDIYVEGVLYDAQGESYAMINNIVARVGDTIGSFLVESIGDSQVILRKADLRFEVTIPHFEEESRQPELEKESKELEQPQPEATSLTDISSSQTTLPVAPVIVE